MFFLIGYFDFQLRWNFCHFWCFYIFCGFSIVRLTTGKPPFLPFWVRGSKKGSKQHFWRLQQHFWWFSEVYRLKWIRLSCSAHKKSIKIQIFSLVQKVDLILLHSVNSINYRCTCLCRLVAHIWERIFFATVWVRVHVFLLF